MALKRLGVCAWHSVKTVQHAWDLNELRCYSSSNQPVKVADDESHRCKSTRILATVLDSFIMPNIMRCYYYKSSR